MGVISETEIPLKNLDELTVLVWIEEPDDEPHVEDLEEGFWDEVGVEEPILNVLVNHWSYD